MELIKGPQNFAATVEAEATAELHNDRVKAAKAQVKDSLRKIAAAEKVLQNLKDEHAVLMRDIGA